jgi:hypothetical protein
MKRELNKMCYEIFTHPITVFCLYPVLYFGLEFIKKLKQK